MNVLIVSRGMFPGFDGPARRVKYLASGLARNGCLVRQVVSYPPSPELCDETFEARYGYRYEHTIHGTLEDSSSLWRKLYLKISGTVKVSRLVAQLHEVTPFDAMLVCGVGFVELLVARAVSRRHGIKLAVDKNDGNYRLRAKWAIGVYGFLSGINIWLSDLLLRRWADVIFTVNTLLFQQYNGRSKGQVRFIIPSFVDAAELDDLRDVDHLYDSYRAGLRLLGVVTTQAHIYGAVPFIRALSQVRPQLQFRLFLLCSNDAGTLAAVRSLLAENGLDDAARILTHVSPDLAHALYAGADILLNGQQEPAIAESGFPGKTAEVLASGKPIITTLFSDVGNYYVDEQNCLVVRYEDLESYKTAILRLAGDEGLRERLGRSGRETALRSFEYVAGTRTLKSDLESTVSGGR